MSVKVKYKGDEILSLNTDSEEALATEGQYCEADIIIENTQDGGAGGNYNINAIDDGEGGQILNITDAQGGGSDPVINPLSVIANGTYTAPDGVDGYSPITVNVPSPCVSGSYTLSADTRNEVAIDTGKIDATSFVIENVLTVIPASKTLGFSRVNNFPMLYRTSSAGDPTANTVNDDTNYAKIENGVIKVRTNSYTFRSGSYTWKAW